MKGQKLLKVTSILMIIGGVIAAIVGVLAILGISALVALAESAEGTGLLYASSAIIIVSSIIEFIAGLKRAPESGRLCQVGHSHRYFVHCLHGYRTYRRRAVQHYQSGTQSAAAGPVFLWRGADEK